MLNKWSIGVAAIAVMSAPAICAAATPVEKVEQFDFNVPAGKLSDVISGISAQAKASILFEGASGGDVNVKGVAGRYSLHDALVLVLDDTEWHVEAGNGGVIRISQANGAVTVTVTARRRDFVRTSSNLLTRTDTPLRQTPGTVDSVTEEVLDSQNAMSVGDALRNLPGVLFSVGGTSQAYVNGDTTGGVTFTGGLRNSTFVQNPPITDVEAIEVLKGPASILTGTQVAGGVINFVPKRATGSRIREVSGGVGSDGEGIVTADISGTLSQAHGLFGRLNVLYQDADRLSNGGNKPYQKVFNPIFGYRTTGFKLDASYQFLETRTAFQEVASYDPGTGVFRSYGGRISRDSGSKVKSNRLAVSFEKDLLSEGPLILKMRGRAQIQYAQQATQFQSPIVYDLFGMGSYVVNLATYGEDKNYSAYFDLFAKFKTGDVSHQFIVAFDARERSFEGSNIYPSVFFTSGVTNSVEPIPKSAVRGTDNVQEYGLIVQDQLTYGRWHGLIGLRQSGYRDAFRDVNIVTQVLDVSPTLNRTKKFLPSGGIVYDFAENISGYASYSDDFKPVAASYKAFNGAALPPTERKQQEVGLKAAFLSNRFNVNLSAFSFTTDSDIMSDPLHPGYYKPTSGSEGSGTEVSVAGSVTPTLKLLAGYTYTGIKNIDGRPNSSPKKVANIWAMKTLQIDDKQSVDLGFGANYNDGFWAVNPLTGVYAYVDREYISANLAIGYSVGTLKINATVNNLFNRENYMPSGSLDQINVLQSRTTRIVVTKRF